jgi:heat shock protein HtpX
MNVYDQIRKNKLRTAVLISVFILFILALSWFGGLYYGADPYGALAVGIIISLVMTAFSYFGGSSMALFTAGAKQIAKEDNPYVWNMVENLSITAGLPMPKVYIIADNGMNAFATGRDPKHASIAFTTGIIAGLENEELEGVAAHELSHVKNYDTLIMTIVVVLVGVIALFADWMLRARFFGVGRSSGNRRGGGQVELVLMIVGLVLVILSPIIAEFIKLAVSRRREYLADASAVLLTRYADGLAGALRKIGAQGGKLTRANHATAHLYISNPFGGRKLSKLWSTHPPIEDRIRALEQMGGGREEPNAVY